MTLSTWLVLGALLDGEERYGAQIGAHAHLPSGTVHPILARLEALGWASARWEDVDPSQAGRPARRFYALTADGRRHARAALARPTRLRPSAQPARGAS